MTITEREQDIAARTNNGESLQAIGTTYGITRERVRQIVNRLINLGYIAERAMNVRASRTNKIAVAKRVAKYGADIPYRTKDAILSKCKLKIKTLRQKSKFACVPFNLQLSDIYPPPTHCPILGIELDILNAKPLADNAMSVDRIIPNRGYVRGNIVVISFRANRIKNDSTIQELIKLVSFYSAIEEDHDAY